MGLLEQDERYGGGAREREVGNAPAIIVHSLGDATAACAAAADAGRVVTLLSARGAAAILGPAAFHTMIRDARRIVPAADVSAVLDCGTDPGHALAAFRAGVETVCLDVPPDAWERVVDIAGQYGGTVVGPWVYETTPSHKVLDLLDAPDPAAACAGFLVGGVGSPTDT